MANTTFKGPVRSQNGFLEWNGTAWVPVQGGGGGMPVVVLTADNAYGTFSGGVTGGVVNLPQLEVGHSLRIVGNAAAAWASDNFVWKVVPYVSAGSDFAYIEPKVDITRLPDPYNVVTESISGGSAPFPPDTLYVYRENLNDSNSSALDWISFEITYLGSVTGGGLTGDVYQIANIPFIAYIGSQGGQSNVDWFHDPLAV